MSNFDYSYYLISMTTIWHAPKPSPSASGGHSVMTEILIRVIQCFENDNQTWYKKIDIFHSSSSAIVKVTTLDDMRGTRSTCDRNGRTNLE